ncbi:hypothetical protein lerEdw1_011453 [Lerista edwardsae]|nr:hypothetical protein lerEdw1_011453 [Lerista edwardsae]
MAAGRAPPACSEPEPESEPSMPGSAALKRAVEALDLLLGRGATSGPDAGPLRATKHADLLESLRCNVALLEDKLAREPQWDELRGLRSQIAERAQWFAPSPDVPWSFASHALLLLLCLQESMALLAAAYLPPPPNARTAEAAPALSPDTLSIAQERTVQAALQFVVMFGVCPYLLPGVGLPLSRRTGFSALVHDMVASPTCLPGATRRLHTTCTVLLQIARHASLGSLLLAHHLGDLLAGLCQLGFCPTRRKGEQAKAPQELTDWDLVGFFQGLTEEERSGCRGALRGLLDRAYQPLAVRELLLLQGGPRQAPQLQGPRSGRSGGEPGLAPAPGWLRRLCGQLLSERLGRPGGVQAVVCGILDGAGGGSGAEADWQKCDAVAKILSSCPQQSLSPEDYFRQLCPQLLRLLLAQDKLAARQFQRVAVTTILAVARQHPRLAEKHLLRPMLEPLLRCADVTEVPLEGRPAGTELVKEEELSGCVESVLKPQAGEGLAGAPLPPPTRCPPQHWCVCLQVYVVGNEPSAVLLGALRPALGVLFALWCFTKQNVSSLRAPCQEILLWFLEKSERESALSVLGGLAGLGGATRFLHPLCQFQPASEGGARVTIRAAVSDEEEALFQKVSWEQWQLEQLGGLVAQCQRSGLAGDFFLRCLKELTPLAGQGAAPPAASSLRSRQSPADLEQCCGRPHERQERQLRVLQVVALLCSCASDTLFTGIAQVVEFVAATLQRACAGLGCSSGTVVESQTLSMAMGLVAVLLGGAVQLQSADFATLTPLVPLLEEVSRAHPEPVVQELAADLRIAICTHGAFATDVVRSATQCVPGSARGAGAAGSGRAGEGSRDEAPRPRAAQPRTPTESSPAAAAAAAADGGSAPRGGRPAGRPAAAPGSSARDLQELLLAAYDPDVPARAAALRTLSHLVEQRDPAALAAQEKLLQVFVENLEHEDSFVYLSAIQGAALLSDVFPAQVLPPLLAQYGSPRPGAVETRLKVGEALVRATRALGDMVSPHRDGLIRAFLRGARDPDSTLRASSLSNLGELCQILRFQLSPVLHELGPGRLLLGFGADVHCVGRRHPSHGQPCVKACVAVLIRGQEAAASVASCLTAVAKTDPEAGVRRAAVHVVVLLLRGLSAKATEVLQDVLLDLYRLLKSVVLREQDEVTVLHAQLALEELDGIVREFLFPRPTLEKKIVVLP